MPPFRPVDKTPDHIALEHRGLERWQRERTFETLRDANRGNPPFSFFDGPITANNPMGVHHAWGRTLKDVWQRYKAMDGHDLRGRTASTARACGSRWGSRRSSA